MDQGEVTIELVKLDTLPIVFIFVVPGLIISFIRSKFITGRRPTVSEAVLTYLILSAIFYCLAFPLLSWAQSTDGPLWLRTAKWFSITIAGPAIFGVLLGIFTQKECGTWLASKFGLSLVHVIPAAWDWRFSQMPRDGLFVLVTLTSGGSVAGLFGTRSFSSSDGSERDIYIEEEYDLAEDGKWSQRPQRVGILISAREIRHIEFWDSF